MTEGTRCKHCGALIPNDAEICPECKYPAHDDHCTFCGAHVFPEDKFCPECGNPIGGIACPQCGAMNFRGFCYNCHEPLTENARQELTAAKSDPLFIRAQTLAKEIEEMIEQVTSTDVSHEEGNSDMMDDENKQLVDSYKLLLANLDIGKMSLDNIPKVVHCGKIKNERRHIDLNQELEAINKKVTDLTNILKGFEPDAQATPQLQRDYCSARKIKMVTKGKEMVKAGWKCNYCGFIHHNPEECDKPKLGGEWKYKEIVIDDINWIKH